ncbi:hypothetical protein ABPG72_018523 [Tetrahymena utriculariae]
MDKTNYFSKCSQHKQHVLNMLQLSSKCENSLICLMCVKQYKLEESELISFEEILNSSSQTIFKNFPPLRDQIMQEKLNKVSEDVFAIQNIQEQIKMNLSEFRQRVNQILSLVEERTFVQLNHLQDLKNNFVDVYNKISSKNELKNLLLDSQEESNKLINLLIEQKKIDADANREQIRKQILDFEEAFEEIDIETPQRMMTTICSLLEQLNYVSIQKLQENMQLQLQINKKNISCVDQSKSHHLIIQELISNRTNYCSEQYLNLIKEQLNKNQHLFNKLLGFENEMQIFNKEKRDSFTLLNDIQLENIRKLSQDILVIETKYSNSMCESLNDYIEEAIQPKSFEIQKILSQQFQYKHLKHSFTKLLRTYPIFEIVEIPKQKSILQQVEIIKALQEHSQKAEVERIQQNQISITATTYKYAQTYLNFVLNPQIKYIIRVNIQQFMNSYENFILFGLISEQDKDTRLLHNDMLSYCERGNEFGMNKIIKGGPLHLNSKLHRNRTFEVRIHLAEKIFKIADYPKYERACEINDKSRLITEQSYRFATELCYKDDKIIIQDILEVEQFDDQM